MRRYILFSFLLVLSTVSFGQYLTVSDFVKVSSLPEQKFAGYLSKQGFFRADQSTQGDTVLQEFQLNARRIAATKDSAYRYAQGLFFDNRTAFSYYTTSNQEYGDIVKSLKEDGFHCENENAEFPYLYQKNDISVKLTTKTEDSVLYYNFLVKKVTLPSPKNIEYAEDFLAFQSHENLEYVFGKANVKKDIYYFSDSDLVRCSVLFPNTNRQVIFLWKDELDRCSLSHLLIGNTLRGKSSSKDDAPVGENVWTLRNGLRANMSLSELIRVNNADFNIYGWNSKYPGIVVPDKKGNIDFKNTGVILSCLNCSGSDLMGRDVVSADEAIENSKRLFVLAFIVMPQKENLSAFHR
jgi:hypothetical protein